MTDTENKYWAFLSYSHQDNGEQRPDKLAVSHRCWGNWLHDALKTFSIPAEFIGQVNGRGELIPERIHPLYRDEPDADASLSAGTRKALEQSLCLIVICSPRSAQSHRVNEAVSYFKQLGRGKYILPIVVAGEPNVSHGHTPGNSPEAECFVPALRHPVRLDGTLDIARRASKFIFVDARHGAEKREILASDHRNAEADLEMAKIQLIALLIGVGFNGLWWREQRRHFFDFAEAQHQIREAQNQVEEAQRQIREAQQKALELQNLPRDVQGQIQEAQSQAQAAQQQVRETQKQLLEFQEKVRDSQNQLEEARQRTVAAESKVLAAENQAREARNQLEETRNLAREAQNQVLELQNSHPEAPQQIQETSDKVLEARNQAQDTQKQLEEIRLQAEDAHKRFLEAQRQIQELQNQARTAQNQLEEARNQVRAAQSQVLETQNQTREAQHQVQEIQNQTRDVRSQIQAAHDQVQTLQNQGRTARRLAKIFALLAVLGLLAAGMATNFAMRQRKVASQALAKADAEKVGNFDPASGGLDKDQIQPMLQNIGGAAADENRRRSLNQLAAGIPRAEIPEALQAASVIVNDEERSHFQKWLLVRLGWINPVSAMTNASAIVGKIVNDEGLIDFSSYFQLAVLDNWMKTDLQAAYNWVRQLPDADSRQRALDKVFHWLQTQPDSESKNKTLETIIDELAKTDIPEALTLAESLPKGNWRSKIMAQLWMKADPFAVSDWINILGLPPEIMRLQQSQSPWTEFVPHSNVGSAMVSPIEKENFSAATNGPVQIKPRE